jgi:hypothetical protein
MKRMGMIYLGTLLIGTGACSQTYEVVKVPTRKMPTSYLFNISKDSLIHTLQRELGKPTEETWEEIYQIKSRESLRRANPFKYLELQTIRNEGSVWFVFAFNITYLHDEYLQNATITRPVGFAKHYVFENTTIAPIYSAHFEAIIRAATDRQTIVTIETIAPGIAIGSEIKWNPHAFWWNRHAVYQKVEPSTIEEYQILLRIGEILGVKQQMPPLN